MYGFSYHPLGLIDYCELVSGRSKSSFLEKLISNKESGRYRVLSEFDALSLAEGESDYLTVSKPDIVLIITTKLRVSKRICESLGALSTDLDVSLFSLADINMSLSQLHLAGDSLTRSEMGFVLPSVNDSLLDEGIVPKDLSDILFLMFFHNSQNNILVVKQAMDKLLSEVNCLHLSADEVSVQILDDLILSSNQLTSVFSMDNLFYVNQSSVSGLKNEFSASFFSSLKQVVLNVIKLGVIYSHKYQVVINLSENIPQYSIVTIIDKLKDIFLLIDALRMSEKTKMIVDKGVVETALKNIIDDEAWFNAVFSTKPEGKSIKTGSLNVDAKSVNEDVDKTVMMSFDKTVVMKKTGISRETDNAVDADVESSDKVMIMSSIDRILRRL